MLRKCAAPVLALIVAVSVAAKAESFSYIPASSAPEKELRGLMESGNFRQALVAWTNAAASGFGQSNDGVATLAYILVKNDMPYTGIELLFQRTRPQQLSASLLKLWTVELKSSLFVQKGWLQTQGPWKAFSVQSTPIKIRNKADITRAFATAQRISRENANESARVLWQIATQAPLIGQLDSSLKALKQMSESGQTLIGRDMVSMTLGRVLYQKGELDAALSAYQQIPKGSSIWVEAVEERAWAHLRKDDYDKAMGVMVTALSPVLAPLAGPESFFLSNLMSLKVCDYSRLFKTSELFKTRHRGRLKAIQDLATRGTNDQINTVFAKFDAGGVSQETAGPLVEFMPRGLFRDGQFLRAMQSRHQLLSEMQTAAKLNEQSNALGGNPYLAAIMSADRAKVEGLRQQAFRRSRTLAQTDVKEYKVILNKMHILEAEVIERLHLDDNLKGKRSQLSKNDDPKGSLVFPYDSQDVWMDELDNYQARVKDCPTLQGASL